MRVRRRPTTDLTVVAWRAAREEVRDALVRDAIPATVGPERDGWTVVRLLATGDDVVEPRGRTVVDLVDDLARTLRAPGLSSVPLDWGGLLLTVCAEGTAPLTAALPAIGQDQAADRSAWSAVLAELGLLDRLAVVVELAAVEPGLDARQRLAAVAVDRRPLAVAGATGLPAQLLDLSLYGDASPRREALLMREIKPGEAHVTASAVSRQLLVADRGRGVLLVGDADEEQAMHAVAVGLATARPVLLLWRQGTVRGYRCYGKAAVEDAHVWGGEWEVVQLDDGLEPELRANLVEALQSPQGDAVALLAVLGDGSAPPSPQDAMTLRTLLRAPVDDTVLARLCALLGLDGAAADSVERGAQALSGLAVERVLPTSQKRAIWQLSTAPRPGDHWIIRRSQEKAWWYRLGDLLSAVGCAYFAVRLWDGGGGLARGGAVVLALLAVVSVVDGVTPAWQMRSPLRHSVGGDLATGMPPEKTDEG